MKVDGLKNVADVGTKHLDSKSMWKCVNGMGVEIRQGESQLALKVRGDDGLRVTGEPRTQAMDRHAPLPVEDVRLGVGALCLDAESRRVRKDGRRLGGLTQHESGQSPSTCGNEGFRSHCDSSSVRMKSICQCRPRETTPRLVNRCVSEGSGPVKPHIAR